MSASSPSLPIAFVAKIVAAPGRAEELGALLTGAVELANQEPGTIVWFAVRSDADTFWIFDAFPDRVSRDEHAEGAIVAALSENAELLAGEPEINPADVLAMKMP
ncbi:MAG: antibiotic biosynthesis monooxygenase [Acidobacteriota bacterium]